MPKIKFLFCEMDTRKTVCGIKIEICFKLFGSWTESNLHSLVHTVFPDKSPNVRAAKKHKMLGRYGKCL